MAQRLRDDRRRTAAPVQKQQQTATALLIREGLISFDLSTSLVPQPDPLINRLSYRPKRNALVQHRTSTDNIVMPTRYWLMKCEPRADTIDNLARDGKTCWGGVRNFQARNFMRDQMQVGDGVLFYASNADPSGVSGLAEIAKTGYPDHFAWKTGHKYYDVRSTKTAPVWFMVDLAFVERFPATVPLVTLKATRSLAQMTVVQKGNRLSVQPVTKAEYQTVVRLGRKMKLAAG